MLFLPSSGLRRQVSSEGTNRIASTFGTAVTPSTGGMGSWASVLGALAEDAYEIAIRVSATGTFGASREIAVEIGADPAGGSSYATIIPALLSGGAHGYDTNPREYTFPLFVPAGTSLAARAYGSVTTACRVLIFVRSRREVPETHWFGTRVEAIGLSGRVGTAIVPGTTTKGTRAHLGATTRACAHWQCGLQVDSTDASWVNAGIHVDLEYSLDAGATFGTLITDALFCTTTGTQMFVLPAHGMRSLPAGADIYARAQSRNDTLDGYTIAAYGLAA